jgi:hypothetical protein
MFPVGTGVAIALSSPKLVMFPAGTGVAIALSLFFQLIPICDAQGVMAILHQAESKMG